MKVRCSQCILLISEPLTLIGAYPVRTRFNSQEQIQCGQISQTKKGKRYKVRNYEVFCQCLLRMRAFDTCTGYTGSDLSLWCKKKSIRSSTDKKYAKKSRHGRILVTEVVPNSRSSSDESTMPVRGDVERNMCIVVDWFHWTTKHSKGAQWPSGRVLDSRPKGRGFEPHRRHCVVVFEQDTFILA